MLKCCSLSSGSSGNSFLVKSNTSNILIDCGISAKRTIQFLDELDISIDKLNGILITHEHIDHVKSVGLISSKYNIPVYANLKTWQSLENIKGKIDVSNIRTFNLLEDFYIGDLQIFAFSTSHDAISPCGFNIYNGTSKISIATDLGFVDSNTLNYLKNSSCIMLESNYDPEILKFSNYPYNLKKRISSEHGHLTNQMAAETVAKLVDSGLKEVLLIHLSKENNFPELAYQTVINELRSNQFTEDTIKVSVAPRYVPSKLYEVI